MNRRVSAGIAASAAAFVSDMEPVSAGNVFQNHAPFGVMQAQSPWQIRVRAPCLAPRNEGRLYGIAGSDLRFSKTVVPELDIASYFADRLAAELVPGTGYSHSDGAGSPVGSDVTG